MTPSLSVVRLFGAMSRSIAMENLTDAAWYHSRALLIGAPDKVTVGVKTLSLRASCILGGRFAFALSSV
ncbi:hypothetical protein RRF57_006166 [Xylaria bambusicola]|uniref:Uncharacterized protein n=1 Tax=Xylaria bambusicola TaxID=326684 RepID=A0AAN7UPS4_9PEZI